MRHDASAPSPETPVQPDQFARIKALFDEVCDLPEPQRSQRLAERASHPTDIDAVRTLLDRTALPVENLIQPVLDAMARSAQEALAVGDRLGVWTLTAEIGQGGMGTVFQAQRSDGHYEQVAAIKLLRGLPSTVALEHLARERQILARLAHPNIARLLDGGATPQGQPYLVLEYIDGEPIDRYCQHHALSLTAMVRLLVAMCDGLGYAHQQLVVHCDLKPGNILVTAAGRPMLLDFGIARMLGEHRPNDSTTAAGSDASAYTPGYASPEQRSGAALSTATDIHSLGRVIQALLAIPTQDGRGRDHARLEAPLQAIAQRASAADPDQRYRSASALSADLQRLLDGQPVLAMGSNPLYRLRCQLRRHALAMSLGTLALLALIGGLIGTSLSLHQAREQRASAEAFAAQATRTADFLGNLLSAVDPDRARDLDKTLLRELLDNAARSAQAELVHEPRVLGQIETVIGTTYYQLGEYQSALVHLQKALTLVPSERVRERLSLRETIADSHGALRDDGMATGEYEAIHRERLATFGAEDPDTLRSREDLTYQWSNNGEFRRAADEAAALQPVLERVLGDADRTTLANLQTLAVARSELGDFAAAEQLLQTLISRHSRVHGEAHSSTAAVANSLAILYLRQKRYDLAEDLLRHWYPLAQTHFGERNFKSMNFAALLASALRLNGKLAESGTYYRLALEAARTAYGDNNAITLRYDANYASFELANGDPAAALRRLDAIQGPLLQLIGSNHPDHADLLRNRGRALTALGRKDAARTAWQSALAIDRSVFGDDGHAQVIEDLDGLRALQ